MSSREVPKMRVEPVRRNLVYFLATVVTVDIFFTHDMLVNHAHTLHTNKKHFHVDQNFLSSKKLQDQEISIHGKYTLKELSSKIKQLKEELANLKDLWDRNLASWDDEVRMDQCLLSINEFELELCKLYEQQGVTRRFDYASIYAT